jgi:hypothetical protein
VFGLANFRINRVLQNTRREVGDRRFLRALELHSADDETASGCEEADDVDIRQWILADDCDVGHQICTDNNIVSLVLSEKSGQDDLNENDSDEATTEVISHTDGLEALERALLYVQQHSKVTPTDVIFMKRWRDIAASSRRSTLYQKNNSFVKKGQFINV